MGHKFEVFSAGCELCKSAINLLKNSVCEDCEIIEYSLQDPIKEEVRKKIEKYKITSVPSIIVDEELKYIGIPKPEEINQLIS